MQPMLHLGPEYQLSLKSVRVLDRCPPQALRAIEGEPAAAGGAEGLGALQPLSADCKAIEIGYLADGPLKTAAVPLPDESFQGIFAACERLANRMLADEFRLNAEVRLSFKPVGEHYIALWHTKEQSFLRCPLQMEVDWSCEYLRRTNARMYTLGVSECEDGMKLAFDRLPLEKTAEVLIHSMFSGLEFVGTLLNTRLRAQRDHAKLVAEGRAG